MSILRAVSAAFFQHWKETTSNIWSLSFFFASVPQVAAFAWIVSQSPDDASLSYLIIGAPLMAIWGSVCFGIVSSLSSEIANRTLHFTMISKTSIHLVLFGKSLAMMIFGIPVGLLSVGVMLVIVRKVPFVPNLPAMLVSILVVFIGLAVTGMLIAPIIALTRGRASGMYTPLLPLITFFSGFLFPVATLPLGLRLFSYLLPPSWIMTGIQNSLEGAGSIKTIATGWLCCLALCIVLTGVTFLLHGIVEKRLRVTGLTDY